MLTIQVPHASNGINPYCRMPAHDILKLITYVQAPVNANADISSRTKGLNFVLNPFMYIHILRLRAAAASSKGSSGSASSEGSSESASSEGSRESASSEGSSESLQLGSLA